MKPNADRFLGRVAGKASLYLQPLQIQEKEIVAAFKRVSSVQQGKKENLKDQHNTLKFEVKKNGGIVALEIEIEYSGKMTPGYAKILIDFGNKCRELGIKKILATSLDRFIRNKNYRSDNKELCRLQPTQKELEELLYYIGEGVTLMTVLHPDSSSEECRSFAIKNGIKVKGSRIKKTKKQIREQMKPIVKQIKQDNPNWSVRKISEETDISFSSVFRWLKEFDSKQVSKTPI